MYFHSGRSFFSSSSVCRITNTGNLRQHPIRLTVVGKSNNFIVKLCGWSDHVWYSWDVHEQHPRPDHWQLIVIHFEQMVFERMTINDDLKRHRHPIDWERYLHRFGHHRPLVHVSQAHRAQVALMVVH